MIALLWSANPALTREQIIDILIRNSSQGRSGAGKDPALGWGKVDMYQAYRDVRALAPPEN